MRTSIQCWLPSQPRLSSIACSSTTSPTVARLTKVNQATSTWDLLRAVESSQTTSSRTQQTTTSTMIMVISAKHSQRLQFQVHRQLSGQGRHKAARSLMRLDMCVKSATKRVKPAVPALPDPTT